VSSRWGSCKQQNRGVLFVYMLLGCLHAVFFFLSRSMLFTYGLCGLHTASRVSSMVYTYTYAVLCACVRTCWSGDLALGVWGWITGCSWYW
jgi:hypothetical protein